MSARAGPTLLPPTALSIGPLVGRPRLVGWTARLDWGSNRGSTGGQEGCHPCGHIDTGVAHS